MACRAAPLRSTLLALTLLGFADACTASTSAPAEASTAPPEAAAPRVLIQGLLFDAPPSGLSSLGVNPATAGFEELVTRAGAHHVCSPTYLATDGVVASMHLPGAAERAASAHDDPLATFRLDVKPHVIEGGRVRLEVDLTLGGKDAKATIDVDDAQSIVLGTDVAVDGRPYVLVLRPNIVRSDADLRAVAMRIAGSRR